VNFVKNISEEEVLSILRAAKTIAIVGISNDKSRISYKIGEVLQQAGYKIIPVNPLVEEILGEKTYPSLLDIKEHVDIVNVFRRSDYVYEVAEQFLEMDATLFWCQLGVVNEGAYDLINNEHRKVLMDSYIQVMYSKL